MPALVTGAAGFVGSHLCEALTRAGTQVRGVDCFTDYYHPDVKRANLHALEHNGGFELVELDLRRDDLDAVLEGVDTIFHLAGQPGVRLSWSDGFRQYAEHNILATQRLLEAVQRRDIARFVYASSSSVYGNATTYPTLETDLPRPHSPYGVTKLAGEHLCSLYADNWGVPTISLRYFTVFGPRQRPDMAIHRFIEAALSGNELSVYGTGEQQRDFTFVGDVVAANMAAGAADLAPGCIVNVAGGSSVTVNQLIDMISELVDTPSRVQHLPPQQGDVQNTGGSIDHARRVLGWEPITSLTDGLAAQVAWHRSRRALSVPVTG